MVFDVLRGYVHVATGLTDVTRQRAKDIADLLVTQSVDAGSKSQEQVQSLTDELMENSRTNRDLLTGLIRTEVERAVNRLGFVREDELAAVRQHVHRLEDQLAKEQHRATERATGALMGTAGASSKAAKSAAGAATKTASGVAGVAARVAGGAASAMLPENAVSVAPKSREAKSANSTQETGPQPTQKAPAKKAPAKKAPVKKAAAKKAPAKKAAAKKAPAKKAPTKKATAKKAPAKKAPAKQAPAKKTSDK